MSALLWLRRDLRIHDNPALQHTLNQGGCRAIFISTPQQWQQHNMAPIQADFIRRHLILVSQQLANLGIELIHLEASDYADQVEKLIAFCNQQQIKTVLANSEPEINEQNRDLAFINTQKADRPIKLSLFQCDTILPVGGVLNKQQQMFKVFTPFKKAWIQQLQSTGIQCLPTPYVVNANSESLANQLSPPSKGIQFTYPVTDSSRWPLSNRVMESVVNNFLHNKLERYQAERDFPSIKATSGLSPYLAIGAISPRWLATQLVQYRPEVVYQTDTSAFSWLNELIWRDFYKHLLFHYPNLAKGESFQPKYQNMNWQNNPDHFTAWCEGKTGYPLVDAAMRQLLTTGWMHNRLRMVVASFLTKHLLVDWRKGEQFFISKLIDGDLAANNGGWQWSASTGCDAQPYFRIFNPITQSKKFDPKGNFIRRYLPELSEIPDKDIHFPHTYLEKLGQSSLYRKPIVEHSWARERALAFYKSYQ